MEHTALISLGTRGASTLFSLKVDELLKAFGYKSLLISPEMIGIPLIRKFGWEYSLKKIIYFKHKKNKIDKIIRIINDHNCKEIIFIFPHPWDIAIQRRIRRLNPEIKFIRIAHEICRHPGDFWPTTRWLKKSIKIDAVVTLSDFIGNKIENTKRNLFIGGHPSFPILVNLDYEREQDQLYRFEFDLIIGRLKKYQNLDQSIRLWDASFSEINSKKLIVAGKANTITKKRFATKKYIIFLENEISDMTFQYLIKRARKVLCLYKEASQSGVVAMCQTFNTPVIVSNVGALPEQVNKYGGGVVLFDTIRLAQTYSEKAVTSDSEKMDRDFISALSSAIIFCRAL